MKRSFFKHLLIVAIFSVIFFVLLYYVTRILIHKSSSSRTIAEFYEEEKETIDVMFMGTSHTYCSFSPMELWNEYGITSYNLGTASQSIPCTYYLLKEAIRTQTPEIVVLDIYGCWYEDYYYDEAKLHEVFDYMPLNKTKIEAYKDLLCRKMTAKKALEYLFPIIKYHGRWSSLQASDFDMEEQYNKGANLRFYSQKQQLPNYTKKTKTLFKGAKEYFDKIVVLCDEYEIDLILCQTPMARGGRYKKTTQKMNKLREYMSEEGYETIEFEKLCDDIEFDYKSDFADKGHVNYYGAMKLTNYIGKYLKENYDLQDHRGDKKYASWNEYYMNYTKNVEENIANWKYK